MSSSLHVSQAEMASPMLLFLWAGWFLLFDNTGSQTFELVRVLPTYFWAILFFGVGSVKMVSVFSGGIGFRRTASLAAGLLWFLIFVLFAFGSFKSFAVPNALFLAYINFLRCYELKS